LRQGFKKDFEDFSIECQRQRDSIFVWLQTGWFSVIHKFYNTKCN
jgi:hypothetical protein